MTDWVRVASLGFRLGVPPRSCENGAQGRDRTTDTVIFSHVLYQLSYLGISQCGRDGRLERERALTLAVSSVQ